MSLQPPFFSIITPVYNCEKYIEKCISSVINQTYGSWELILVDDGSTDNSGEICDRYQKDTRIRVIHQKNSGAFKSRLSGIAIANGKYELGLDSDDYLETNCLEVIKRAIDDSGCDLILYSLRLVGNKQEICNCSLVAGKKYSAEEILKEVILNTNHSLCNKAIKLDIVKRADYTGLNINKRILNDDYALIIPIVCNINIAYVIDDILYNYRIYEESSSHVMCTADYILDTGVVTEFAIHRLETCNYVDTDFCKLTYLAYLNMIGSRLFKLFINKRIALSECKSIHASAAYINARKYESIRYFSFFRYLILRLFRDKQYWIIKLIAMIYRIKNNINL